MAVQADGQFRGVCGPARIVVAPGCDTGVATPRRFDLGGFSARHGLGSIVRTGVRSGGEQGLVTISGGRRVGLGSIVRAGGRGVWRRDGGAPC